MMCNWSVTATELKRNLGKYLLFVSTEEIYITKNGKTVAKLANSNQDRVDLSQSLFGILPQNMTLDEAKAERLVLVTKDPWGLKGSYGVQIEDWTME